jgi:hypothetical protein
LDGGEVEGNMDDSGKDFALFAGVSIAASALRGVPQALQKRASVRFRVLHFGQFISFSDLFHLIFTV